MKNKFKSFSISLMIVFLLVTISCQVEETIVETENIKNQNDLLIKKISFNEIKNSAVVDKINNTKKLSKKTITTSSKIIKDTLNNFYINSDEGMYIEKTDGTKSYTFSVFRENATDLENLVIIVYPNNQIKTFLVDYNKTFNELNSMSLEQMQNNQIEYYEINFNTNEFIPVFQNNSNGRYICETIMFWDTIPCYEGDLVGAGQGIDCWGWVIIGHTCWEGGSGGGEGFGFDSDFGTNGNGSPTGGGGSTGSGSSGSSSNQIITTPTTSLESEQEAQALIKRQKNFTANLSWNQNAWLNNNQEAENNIYEYLESQVTDTLATEYSTESVQFVNELIDLANNEEDEELIPNLINLSIITKQNGYFENSFDTNFYNLINPYTEVDTQAYNPLWSVYFTTQCAIARYKLSQEPEWNNLYGWQQDAWVYWEASKEMLHLGLDLIGLVPVVGEVADLTNGVIYTIEGDGVNATLSFASTIPIAGWFSAGVKFAKRADGLAYTVKAANNLISFGAYNSKKFRASIGLLPGDPRQAHHLIPRDFANNALVQKAAKATTNQGFHMHSALNGIPMPTTNHLTGHNLYSQKVLQRLNYLNTISPTPQIAYQQINSYINHIKIIIQNNPNMNLGQISNLID